MLLNILIPTYNRSEQLVYNLSILEQYIELIGAKKDISIIISDNASDSMHSSRTRDYIANNHNVSVEYYVQETNIGFEANCLFLLKNAVGTYVMLLGDDDYIEMEYLSNVVSYLRNGKCSAIFPNYYPINELGEQIGKCRDLEEEDKLYYREKDIAISVKAHQMSGLVFLREGVYDAYVKNVKSNVYPQFFFMAFNMMRGDGVHITRYPMKNTVAEKKNFGYQFDKLYGDIARSVDGVVIKKEKERKKFLKEITMYNWYRIVNEETIRRPYALIRKVKQEYLVSENFQKIIIGCYFYVCLRVIKNKIFKIKES